MYKYGNLQQNIKETGPAIKFFSPSIPEEKVDIIMSKLKKIVSKSNIKKNPCHCLFFVDYLKKVNFFCCFLPFFFLKKPCF